MCRFACPVAHQEARETVTPWGLMSLLRLAAEDHIPFDEAVVDVLARCTGCLRCQTACLHDNDVPRAMFEGRALARARGLEVWSAGEMGVAHDLPSGAWLGFAAEAPIGFYAPAWNPAREERVRRLAAIFTAIGEPVQWIELSYGVSAYDLLASGHEPLFRDRAAQLAKRFSGFAQVITDDEGLVATSRQPGWNKPWNQHDVTLVHWTEFVASRLEALGAGPEPEPRRFAYHDGCRLGRGAGVYDAPRAILSWATGVDPVELVEARDQASCCGQGAGYSDAAPTHATGLARDILRVATEVGAEVLVSASDPCATHLKASGSATEVVALDQILFDALGARGTG